ncbi:hypothetical protein ABZZ36_41760 [Actinacidiphila glaucinigra]|uniref:hypothetical protein n=1 Tax=Actinacidiphila glaucinigra TaxID=235986 RepID=UPI0033B9189C
MEGLHVVVWMLSKLKDLDPHGERFSAKMTVLMENVPHHAAEKEQDDLVGGGTQSAAARTTVDTNGHP